ncbi:hypothetical protein IU11_14040 [Cellulosimicrobium sp. MM]|nr:hypothetical protein [Cellulosimicrobium sp. MM]KFD43158.1 hypothetical protein IU11_14040 [Cellulosimicrobium sp. MM]
MLTVHFRVLPGERPGRLEFTPSRQFIRGSDAVQRLDRIVIVLPEEDGSVDLDTAPGLTWRVDLYTDTQAQAIGSFVADASHDGEVKLEDLPELVGPTERVKVVAGARGPAGPVGPTGSRGTLWYVSGFDGVSDPADVDAPRAGDLFLYPSSGDTFRYSGSEWIYIGALG